LHACRSTLEDPLEKITKSMVKNKGDFFKGKEN
jgi:hypothetical protein